MYYSSNQLFSHNAPINFVMSGRGHGKSFEGKTRVIRNFLKDKSQTMYIRRNKIELDRVKDTYWNDIKEHYPNLDFKVKGDIGYINGEIAVYFLPLSTSTDLKSASFPKVTLFIFDEYLIPQSTYKRYLKNEMFLIFDIIETVLRMRENARFLFLSNSISYVNPFFTFFDIEIKDNKRFHKFKEGLICVEIYDNEEFKNKKKETWFSKLVEGTPYYNYAIENKVLEDNEDFIKGERKGEHIFVCSLYSNNYEVGVWINENVEYYIDEKIDYNSKYRFAILNEDMKPHYTSIKAVHKNWRVKKLKEEYSNANIYYSNQEVKKFFLNNCLKYL